MYRRLDVIRSRVAMLVSATPELRLVSLDDLSGTLGTIAAACQTAYVDLGVTATELALSGPWSRAQRAASS